MTCLNIKMGTSRTFMPNRDYQRKYNQKIIFWHKSNRKGFKKELCFFTIPTDLNLDDFILYLCFRYANKYFLDKEHRFYIEQDYEINSIIEAKQIIEGYGISVDHISAFQDID